MSSRFLNFFPSLEKKSFFYFITAIFIWFLCVFLIFSNILKWPYTGADFISDIENRVIIVSVIHDGSPADVAGLESGDRFRAILKPDDLENRFEFTGLEATTGRVKMNSYQRNRDTVQAKKITWDFIKTGKFILERDNGEQVLLAAESSRPFFSLPLRSYLTMLQSFIVICIAAGIFSFAKPSFGVSVLTISGVGLVVNSLTNAVLSAKEIVMPPDVLSVVTFFNTLGSSVFIYALLALFWYVPRKINDFPFGAFTIIVGLSIFLSQYFMVFEFPGHPYQVPNLLPLPIALVISAVQWIRTVDKPLERASVMWFMISIYGVTGLVVLLYSVPILLGYAPILSPHVAGFTLSFIYIGIAFGTLKFRLFDVQRIWWRAVVWIIGGFFVVAADLLLVAQFDLGQHQALPLALVIAGWAYFPIRQAIMERFIGRKEVKVSSHVPDLVKTFSSVDDIELFEGKFIAFLKRTFQAQEIGEITRKSIDGPMIMDNGLALAIPNLRGDSTLSLIGKYGGRQLFSKSDIVTVNSFLELVRSLGDVRKQEFTKQKQERERIIRDLHDDVGGRLLSSIYDAKDEKSEAEAKDTLVALKESLIVIENSQSIDFSSAWHQMKENAEKRLGSANFQVSIKEELTTTRMLSAREYINIKRILQEIISNVIKHGKSGNVRIDVILMEEGALCISCTNKIADDATDSFSSGRGVASIRKRLEEINGNLEINTIQSSNDEFTITVTID